MDEWDGAFKLDYFARSNPRGAGASPNHYVFEFEYKLSNGVSVWVMMKHYMQDVGRAEYSYVAGNTLSTEFVTIEALVEDGEFLASLSPDPLHATLLVQDFIECLQDVEARARPVLRSLALGTGNGLDVGDLEGELRRRYSPINWDE